MYNQFYGFKENPFNQTPDTSFFFPSKAHKEALDALVYAIRQRKGFVVITGEIGAGKTTVTRALLHELDRSVQCAVITNTSLSPKGMLSYILSDLGVHHKDGSKDKLLLQLNEYLIDQIRKNRNVMLMIDEAQNLSPACLEEIRMLSNLETEKEKLLQIVLVGQPELRSKLEMRQLEQLRQRVAVHYHIKPLSKEDTVLYINHRLRYARIDAESVEEFFDAEACEEIFRQSQGIPRIINNICDHALLSGFVSDQRLITKSVAMDAISTVMHTSLV